MKQYYPYLSDYRISGQESALCGHACLVVASSYLNKSTIKSRNEFLTLQTKVENSITENKHHTPSADTAKLPTTPKRQKFFPAMKQMIFAF